MEETKVYTQQEVLKHINIFTEREDNLLDKRKELNKELNRVRKQKQHWKELDLSQIKLL